VHGQQRAEAGGNINNIKRLHGAARHRANNIKRLCGTTLHSAAQSFDIVYFAAVRCPCASLFCASTIKINISVDCHERVIAGEGGVAGIKNF
jgi:hypothetical protein